MISFKSKDYLYSSHTPKTQGFKMHLHNYYEFLYFISGDATYIIEDSEYQAHAGDLFITRPKELHSIVFYSNSHEYYRKFIQISPSFLSDSELELLHFINTRPNGQYNKISAELAKKYGLDRYFEQIEPYIINRVPESDLMVKSYIIQFLVSVNNVFKSDESTMSFRDSRNPKIEVIVKYINEHLNENILLDTLANMVYISKYHMCHIFKKEMGQSIKEYINVRRITKAKTLISNGADFTSVCFQCGFNDYSSFYKTFKKLTGMSPREFLK